MATLAVRGGSPTVLAVGVEKMWTGDRGETLAGIEDGVPSDDRRRMHEQLENPSGSVLMALNASWANSLLEERGATVEQFAAAAVKARRHGALNPNAQFQSEVTLEEVLSSSAIVLPLTRLMCSSFTDGAAAVVVARRDGGGGAHHPQQHHPVGQRRPRLPRAPGRDGLRRLGRVGRGPRRRRRGGAPRRHQPRGDLRPGVAGLLQAGGRRAGHPVRRHHHRGQARHGQHQRGPGGPGPPAGRHRDRPGGRAHRAAPGPGRSPGRSRGPAWRWPPTPAA